MKNNIFVYTSEKNRKFFENEQLFVHNITCSVNDLIKYNVFTDYKLRLSRKM
jgi:hypothetical protein